MNARTPSNSGERAATVAAGDHAVVLLSPVQPEPIYTYGFPMSHKRISDDALDLRLLSTCS